MTWTILPVFIFEKVGEVGRESKGARFGGMKLGGGRTGREELDAFNEQSIKRLEVFAVGADDKRPTAAREHREIGVWHIDHATARSRERKGPVRMESFADGVDGAHGRSHAESRGTAHRGVAKIRGQSGSLA